MENPMAASSPSLVGSNPSFAKFLRIQDPIISQFVSTIPNTFEDAVQNLLAIDPVPVSERVLLNRSILARLASKFHSDAGTLTASVLQNIANLEDPQARLVVATHQPNLFPYGGIFKKMILLEALKRKTESHSQELKTIPVFFIIDHDFLDEMWMRVAQLPSLQNFEGVKDLRLSYKESDRWKMVCKVPLPNQAIISKWKSEVRAWIRSNSKSGDERRFLIANLDDLWTEYEAAFSRAKSYADLNSFFMSRIVNSRWEYSMLFIRLSETATMFENGFSFLLTNYNKYSDALRSAERLCMSHGIDTGVSSSSHSYAPLWLHCACGSKAAPRILNTEEHMMLEGSCISCRKNLTIDLGDPDKLELNGSAESLSPKAIPILLLLAREIGLSSYISGTGGLGYLVDGQFIAKKLGVSFPTVFVWSSRDTYEGIGQRAAISISSRLNEPLEKRIESLETLHRHLELLIRPLLSERSEIARKNMPMETVLSKIFSLKVEQRKVRNELDLLIRARNALSLSSCFVDYAVNFGVRQTESMWTSHLDKRGTFAEPVTVKALSSIAV